MEKTAQAGPVIPLPRRSRGAWVLAAVIAVIVGAWFYFVVGETRFLPTVTLPDGTKARVRSGTRGVPISLDWNRFPHHTGKYEFSSTPPDRWRWCKDQWNSLFGHLPDWLKAHAKPFPKASANIWSAQDPHELLFEVTGGNADQWPWTVYAIDDSGVRTLLSRIHNPWSARGIEMEEGWEGVGQCGPLPTQSRTLLLQIEKSRRVNDPSPPGPVVAELVIDNPFFSKWRVPRTRITSSQLLNSSTVTLLQATPKRGSVDYPWERAEFQLRVREERRAPHALFHRLCAASLLNAEYGWERVDLTAADFRPSEKLHSFTCRARAWPSEGPWRFRTWWFPAWTETRPPVPSFAFLKLPVPKTGDNVAVRQSSSSGVAELYVPTVRGGTETDAGFSKLKPPFVVFWLSGMRPALHKPFRAWLVRDSKGRTADPDTGLPYEMRVIDIDQRFGYRCAMKLPEDVEWFDLHLTSAEPTMIELDVIPDPPR